MRISQALLLLIRPAKPWQSISPTCNFTELFGKKCMFLAGVEKGKVEVPAFMDFGNS